MKLFRICLVSLLAFAMFACSTPKNAPANLQGVDFPDWVTQGSGKFAGDAGRVFHGVGSVNGIKNEALARTTAANRARNEIAKVFEVYSASSMKDYMAATTAGDMTASSEEQHVEQAIKTFTAQTLSGIEVAEFWFHPNGDEVYALAQMDLEKFKNAMDNMKELSSAVRDYVRKNADRVHMDLENEEEKHATP